MVAAVTPPADLPLVRLSVAQYHAMRDAGIFDEDDHIELLAGLLVPKMTKNPAHRLSTHLVRSALERAALPGCYVDSQEPITTEDSEPEPDVVVVRGTPRDYRDRHPGPGGDVLLVVEVADESLARDRDVKRLLYARAGIPLYWIVDLRARTVETFSSPKDGDYAQHDQHAAGTEVSLTMDGRVVARASVDGFLP